MTFESLKLQKRWVCWKLVPKPGGPKPTKIPYQTNGKKARNNDPTTWSTYAECLAVVSQFDGIGLELGEVAGVCAWGVDFDDCCDAATGKFSAETREVVIRLNTYTEYSPSGTGCHVLGIGALPGPGMQKPFPGCKQIEVKSAGYYFTFTGRHITKTPADLQPRQAEISELWHKVNGIKKASVSLTLSVSATEEERFAKLWAGDTSAYNDDHSAADFALCILLAKKHKCNAFTIDTEFRKSRLYRDKWERDDYREKTITRAIVAVAKDQTPIFDADEEEPMVDDGADEYVVNALSKEHEGWFPKGDQSVVAGMSGVGKTYWVMTLLEKARVGDEVWGHSSMARDYRVLMLDRGARAMRRTLNRLGVSTEARKRVIRVTGAQCSRGPVSVLTELVDSNPGVEVWFVEGLDLWIPDSNKMNVVGPILDDLQRLAARRFVAFIYSVGSGKEKVMEGRDTERYHGRDVLFGSVAWGRKSETIVVISKTDLEDSKAPRQYSVMVRNGEDERLWMAFQNGELCVVPRPEHKETGDNKRKAFGLCKLNVFKTYKAGERILYSEEFGVSKGTYYDWLKYAVDAHLIERRGDWYVMPQNNQTPPVGH